jgi:hypothetical protein
MNKFLTTIFAVVTTASTAFADVSIQGQIEERVETTSGVSDLKGDNYVGVTFNEQVSDTVTAFGKVEFTVDGDSDANADAVTNREVYAGIDFGAVAVSAGKMPNLRKSMIQSAPGYFKANSLLVTGQSRADDTVKVEGKVSGVTLAATTVLDGTADADRVGETHELGASVELGGVTLSAVGTKVGSAETTMMYAAKAKVGDVKLGVAHEPDATNVKTTVTGSMSFGSNTLMVGNQFVDGSEDTMIAEGTHNFSKNVYAFAGYKKPETSDATAAIGLGIKF